MIRVGSLHLDDRHRGRVEQVEVGQHVGLARRREHLAAVVVADLGEYVCVCAHVPCLPGGGRHQGRFPGSRDLKAFIELPYRLHANHPQWVPPLRLERRLFLNRRMNAFFTHGEAEYFLARRDGRVVGRITAHVNHAFNDHHNTRWGWFGFIEFEQDAEVLAGAARRRRGVAARPRLRAHARAGELRAQRRRRHAHRGLRSASDDPADVEPALVPADDGAGRDDQGDGPADVEPRGDRTRRGCCR